MTRDDPHQRARMLFASLLKTGTFESTVKSHLQHKHTGLTSFLNGPSYFSIFFILRYICIKHFCKYNIYVDLESSQGMYKNRNARSEIVLSHCDENLNKPTCPMVVKPLPTRGHQISSCSLKCYN